MADEIPFTDEVLEPARPAAPLPAVVDPLVRPPAKLEKVSVGISRAGWAEGIGHAVGLLVGTVFVYVGLTLLFLVNWLVLGLFILVGAAVLGSIYWVAKWSTWGVWFTAVAVGSPILVLGAIEVAFGGGFLLIFGISLILVAGCGRGLDKWLDVWIASRRLSRLDQAAARANRGPDGGMSTTFAGVDSGSKPPP